MTDDLRLRLEGLSKVLESSGRIDEHDTPGAYSTILDAMRFVMASEYLLAERARDRARVDSLVRLLAGIHNLLYPPPLKMRDGSTMVFRPRSLDPHEVLQELSDRIRALPDELERVMGGGT